MDYQAPYVPEHPDRWLIACKWGCLLCTGTLGLLCVYGAVFAGSVWLYRWMGG